MLVTSQEANKIVKKIQEEIDYIKLCQRQSMTFLAASFEDKEELRPEYDFQKTQNKITILEEQLRNVKHAINIFNSTTVVMGGMTIDQVLIFLPQLTERKRLLAQMKEMPEKMRAYVDKGIIDYKYRNYSLEEVAAEYEAVDTMLTTVQTELDKINANVKFEIPY